jgi:hypothetical protein
MLGDILLSILSLFLTLAIVSLFLEFLELSSGKFEIGVNLFFGFVLVSLIATVTIQKLFISNSTRVNSKQIYELLLTSFLIGISQIFFKLNSSNDNILGLKLLLATGEDNAAWLTGLSEGLSNDSYDLSVANRGGGSLTGVISLAFSSLQSFGNSNYDLSSNISALFRLYMILICIGFIIVGLISFRFAQKFGLAAFSAASIAITSAIAFYLTSVSFAVYGHLTPIQSSIFVFAAIGYLLQHRASSDEQLTKSTNIRIFISFILLFAASRSWTPIGPVIGILVLFFFVKFTEAQLRKHSQKSIYLAFVLLVGILCFRLYGWVDFAAVFKQFTLLVHWPGGTMHPSQLQILLSLVTTLALISVDFRRFADPTSALVIKVLLSSFLIFYVFVVAISITTSPYSTSYAASKLGLFISLITTPFLIMIAGALVFNRVSTVLASITFVFAFWAIFYSLGPPTGPPSPSYNQFGYPFALINEINRGSYNLGWIDSLVTEVRISDNKRILCFESEQVPLITENARKCTRFASGIQGVDLDPMSGFWQQVNLNVVAPIEVENKIPSNFFETYKIMRTNPEFESSTDPNQIEISKVLNSLRDDSVELPIN